MHTYTYKRLLPVGISRHILHSSSVRWLLSHGPLHHETAEEDTFHYRNTSWKMSAYDTAPYAAPEKTENKKVYHSSIPDPICNQSQVRLQKQPSLLPGKVWNPLQTA